MPVQPTAEIQSRAIPVKRKRTRTPEAPREHLLGLASQNQERVAEFMEDLKKGRLRHVDLRGCRRLIDEVCKASLNGLFDQSQSASGVNG